VSGELPTRISFAHSSGEKSACRANLALGNLDAPRAERSRRPPTRSSREAARSVRRRHLSGGRRHVVQHERHEVLANRALEILGRARGDYSFLSPNDHVNRAQSTNDTFRRRATWPRFSRSSRCSRRARSSPRSSERKAASSRRGEVGPHASERSMPVRLGQTFHAYGTSVARACRWVARAGEELEEVALAAPRSARHQCAAGLPRKGGRGARRAERSSLRPASDPFWQCRAGSDLPR